MFYIFALFYCKKFNKKYMALPNIYEQGTINTILDRLEKLTPQTAPQWGKMNAPQMLAHLNVAYDIDNGKMEAKTPALVKFMLRLFLKPVLVNEKPYKTNSRTAPAFIINSEKDFETEKQKLIANIKETQAKGPSFYEGRESASVGKLTAIEWNNMYYKHLNHHFTQFGI
jgi:hypothetical protein